MAYRRVVALSTTVLCELVVKTGCLPEGERGFDRVCVCRSYCYLHYPKGSLVLRLG